MIPDLLGGRELKDLREQLDGGHVDGIGGRQAYRVQDADGLLERESPRENQSAFVRGSYHLVLEQMRGFTLR